MLGTISSDLDILSGTICCTSQDIVGDNTVWGDGIVMEELIATTKSIVIGPSVVRALHLAAGTNEGGHYFRATWELTHIGPR